LARVKAGGGFGGTITTVRCVHDNALAKSLLEEDGWGCVLVVDDGGSTA
jgi:regulator of ribonuclease activity A